MAAKKAKPKKALRKKVEPRKSVGKKTNPRKKVPRAPVAAKAKPKKTSRASAKSASAAKPKSPSAARRKPARATKSSASPAKSKAAASARMAAPARTPAKTNGVRRYDRAGHLDPHYAAELLARSREGHDVGDDEPGFVRGNRSGDRLAEELGEEAVETMTSGEDDGGQARDEFVSEEIGGPFVETSAKREFAEGSDESNPADATREPFPKT